MNRKYLGAYVVGAIEFLLGCPLALGAYQLGVQIQRESHPKAEDWLAVSGLTLAGGTLIAAGIVAFLIGHISTKILRGTHISAVISQLWMMISGAAMMWIGRTHGGDWAGITILGGMIFLAIGALLFLLAFFALRYVNRVENANSPG